MPGPAEPPVIHTDDVMEVTFVVSLLGQTCLSVLHYRLEAGDDDSYPDVVNAMDTWIDANLKNSYLNALAQNAELVSVVYQVVAPGDRYVRIEKTKNEMGTFAADANTADVCGVITKRTWVVRDSTGDGRGATGSLHMPGLPSSQMENGLLKNEISDLIDALAQKIPLFQENIGNTSWYPVLLHRPSTTPLTDDITTCSVKPQVRVMRRRTVGYGI